MTYYLIGVVVAFLYLTYLAKDDEKFTQSEIFTGVVFSFGSWIMFAFLVAIHVSTSDDRNDQR